MIQPFIIELLIILTLPFSRPEAQQPDCAECHGDLLDRAVVHYPAEDACDNCHEATGATHPLGDSLGFRITESTPGLCYLCHEEPAQKAHPHQPWLQGQCLGCHDPHGSSQPLLLRSPDPELCLSCHNREYKTDSTITVNIGRLIQGKMKAHSAITLGGCASCHQAHGSDFRELLVAQFPEEDYLPATSENFELCFLCHDTGIIELKETEGATGFRDSTKNLHWLHINGNRGRNCRMCHNIHGSPQPFLVEERVRYGDWEMEMNFVPEEQGGSCLPGCHGKLSYRR